MHERGERVKSLAVPTTTYHSVSLRDANVQIVRLHEIQYIYTYLSTQWNSLIEDKHSVDLLSLKDNYAIKTKILVTQVSVLEDFHCDCIV